MSPSVFDEDARKRPADCTPSAPKSAPGIAPRDADGEHDAQRNDQSDDGTDDLNGLPGRIRLFRFCIHGGSF